MAIWYNRNTVLVQTMNYCHPQLTADIHTHRYSLKFTRCLLLIVKLFVTCWKIHSLLVADVARCNKSLVTRCRSCSLKKTTLYLLQNLLVTRYRSCSLQKFTRYSLQNSLDTRCRSCSLEKFTPYSLQNSLLTRCRSCSLQKITHYSLRNSLVTCCKKSLVTRCRSFSLQKIICHR